MKNLFLYQGKTPQTEDEVYIAPGAKVIGDVFLGKGASIWYNAVLRGDVAKITIKEYTNIQDNSVVHSDVGIPVYIGKYVTVGHNAVIHACIIHDYCLIGMGAVILNEAEVGEGSIVGAGAVVTKGLKIPPYSLVLGVPGKVIKSFDSSTREERKQHALSYYKLAQNLEQH